MSKPPAAAFGTALRRLIDHLDGALEQAYRDDGLDFRPRYTPILRAIIADGPQTLRALSARLGVSHSAISQTVSQMVARDLVSVATGTDARQRIVALGPMADSMLPRLERHWAAAQAATEALDEAVGGGLVAAVERTNDLLGQRPFENWLDDCR